MPMNYPFTNMQYVSMQYVKYSMLMQYLFTNLQYAGMQCVILKQAVAVCQHGNIIDEPCSQTTLLFEKMAWYRFVANAKNVTN